MGAGGRKYDAICGGRKTWGFGLKLIRDFITKNKGRIIIVSDAGYWELRAGRVSIRTFSRPFPGTVVTFEINTADTSSYALAEEINPSTIS